MSAPEAEQDPIAAAGDINARLLRFILIAVVITHVLLVASVWGQWTNIALITGVFFLVVCLNLTLARPAFSEQTRLIETIRLVGNMVANLVYGHFTGWQLPMWLYLPLDAIWVDTRKDRRGLYVLFGPFLVVGIAAVLDGCPPLVPLVFIILSVIVHAISRVRMHLLHEVLSRLAHRHRELARAHQELAQAHERALQQDRLSSLGMLAAGVAHEINNPLAYVKSNVNALYRDLQDEKPLPPVLSEYVTEVLPATLEGIQRIATIVSDLRRFARGDPEPLSEYDLNDEVQAALRITHSRIVARCRVVLKLRPLPRMLGRPQQMAQVVVNLLINAAQATPTEGQISLSTRHEGSEVVLVVQDTGQGMTPEVQQKLFQPFFSTRPIGEGTGMGLAVVHGIVSAHGGRIDVESQPGKGSTFTIRLPLAAPAPRAAGV
jgi:two-component system NtrC family sensor kinase